MIPKFRAWDKARNEMNYKVMVGNCDTGDENWTCPIIWIEERQDWLHFDDYDSIMQSTGLSDELGKELFEGDIILWTYWDEFEDSGSAKIVFDKGMFKLLDIRTGKEVWDNLSDCIENCNVYIEGNIYENPELLEDKE
jgi:uncharacterized phage protein (TIGR01671 family)